MFTENEGDEKLERRERFEQKQKPRVTKGSDKAKPRERYKRSRNNNYEDFLYDETELDEWYED